ncbi:myosin-binding protein 7-like isoform X2 [Salvia miltiorrhiza]|uniref:myosin-binding protein 7-like isoform X2 n=1 Tax=Salvia miltiorrhiza TaxID=226208 RepID=UPI0025AD6373|nr:myosin-binding protein 7-like isoform X2 [Salvia miltiorrhiza]XP_057778364.1 myosin-binding protein 7-like isoform X2 [Salvia miltiorrhiza]
MDSGDSPPSASEIKCCDRDCDCNESSMMENSPSGTCIQAVKRKCNEFEEETCLSTQGVVVPQNARVEIGNECTALRQMVISQQQTIEDLISELEEERNAASTAANEALSMILRLQKDKAEIQMELRQFKRFAEEKMAHDQQETLGLEDMLYKREEAIQSLSCEIEAYRHRMMSYGLSETEVDGVVQAMSRNYSMIEDMEGQFDYVNDMYPPLKCNLNESQAYPVGDDEIPDIEKYAFGETPHSGDQLKDLECRINQLEKSPRAIYPDGEFVNAKNVLEKVVVGHSPRASRKFCTEGPNSPFAMAKEKGQYYSPRFAGSFKKSVFSYIEENPRKADNASEYGDEMCDRVCTIDSVQHGPCNNQPMSCNASFGVGGDEYMGTPKELNYSSARDLEIQKLYARLHSLEADRESMRQAIISMGTEKAQVVLLKEIAQNLCKEMSPKNMPMRKQPETRKFTFMSIFKWIVPIFSWRKRGRRARYMFGLSANNIGMLVLLDRSPRVGLWRHQFITNM